jgi:OmpA-OmpF porin, OOP family
VRWVDRAFPLLVLCVGCSVPRGTTASSSRDEKPAASAPGGTRAAPTSTAAAEAPSSGGEATPLKDAGASDAAEPDRDGDRVNDARDACPEVPGAPRTDAAQSGCPGLVQVEGRMLRLMKPVRFEIGKAQIRPESYEVLDAAGDALRALDCERVELRGHDARPDPYPMGRKLSQSRAQSVRQYLIQKAGISIERLEANGYGATQPLLPESDPRARERNLRIEVVLRECTTLGIFLTP